MSEYNLESCSFGNTHDLKDWPGVFLCYESNNSCKTLVMSSGIRFIFSSACTYWKNVNYYSNMAKSEFHSKMVVVKNYGET